MTQYNQEDFPKNLIFLGPQGSGKGTQAGLLVQKFDFALIEAGKVLRGIAKDDTELGRKVKERIDQGKLVDSETMVQVMKKETFGIPADRGLIFDGYPRNISQYKLMKEFCSEVGRNDFKVLYIHIPEEESIRRLTSRRICENCGRNYIVGTVESCSECGGRLIQRHDDYPEAVKSRLTWSSSELLPLVEELKKEGKLIAIDGRPSIEEIHREILEKLKVAK